jgi:hypothetical protein
MDGVQMTHPYNRLPRDGVAFWQPAVANRNALEISGLWSPKWGVSHTDTIVTAGSCFAQHIGKALQKNSFRWLDAEPPPSGLAADVAQQHGYGIFSFRTGNIYTTALLRQWIEWALGSQEQSSEVWERRGRFFDPFRPAIEPDGFASADEVAACQRVTLGAIRRAISEATVFVFTLGLTEAWTNSSSGVVYPMCPGTVAGEFDEGLHQFQNLRYSTIYQDMAAFIELARSVNPGLRFLLTVSPVPLTATASGSHVLAATTYSKSVLRAVAGDLCVDYECVDYFPSYEIITAPVFRGMFYKPNAREVSPKGVDFVMTHFFSGLGMLGTGPAKAAPIRAHSKSAPPGAEADEVQCEDALLDAFGS